MRRRNSFGMPKLFFGAFPNRPLRERKRSPVVGVRTLGRRGLPPLHSHQRNNGSEARGLRRRIRMKLVLFHQYDQLLAKIMEVARCCAKDAADWKICTPCSQPYGRPDGRGICVSASNGIVHLHGRVMNVLSVSGGETRIVIPDIEPERANISQSEGLPRSGALAGVQFCCVFILLWLY